MSTVFLTTVHRLVPSLSLIFPLSSDLFPLSSDFSQFLSILASLSCTGAQCLDRVLSSHQRSKNTNTNANTNTNTHTNTNTVPLPLFWCTMSRQYFADSSLEHRLQDSLCVGPLLPLKYWKSANTVCRQIHKYTSRPAHQV